MLLLIVPLLLIVLEGIFAASETGLISLENITVLKAKREKKRWAILVDHFLARPEHFFSTILVCENFILVIASTLFAKFFIERFGSNSVVFSTIILSFISLTIGLFIPKSLALSYPSIVMSNLSRIIYYLQIITYPVVYIYANISKSLAHLFRSDTKVESIKRLDIIYAMSEYEVKASRLAARLFNFSKRVVAEVMIPLDAVFSCEKGHEREALSKKYKRIYTRIPVYEKVNEKIIGVFNIKDYFYTNRIKLRKPFFVSAHERCMPIFSTMKQKGEHMAIVRDSHKRILGIVTLEDLMEELVGEIRDEK